MISLFVIAILVLATLVFYSFIIESRWVKYRGISVHSSKPLPEGGLNILHLSDMHFKRWNPRLVRIFRSLGKTTYDLILITGDMIDTYRGNHSLLTALGYLRARYGTYCVFGNHEYLDYNSFHLLKFLLRRKNRVKKNPKLQDLKNGLARLGIVHLGNRNCVLKDLGITLVGVDDFRANMSRMEHAQYNLSGDTFNILLAHHPDSILAASPERIDLALCGHTHGGQIRLPFIGALLTDSHLSGKNARGRVLINGIDTFVHSGLGTTGSISGRFLCRPEIVQMRVVSRAGVLPKREIFHATDSTQASLEAAIR